MNDEQPVPVRVSKLRTVLAFLVCSTPAVFCVEGIFIVVNMSLFEAMFADYGAKLPVLTEWALRFRLAVAGVLVAAALAPALLYWRKGLGREHVLVSAALGALNFAVAQALLFVLFLPIFQLGMVSGG